MQNSAKFSKLGDFGIDRFFQFLYTFYVKAGWAHIEYYYGTVKDCLDCKVIFDRPSSHLCYEDMPALGIWIDWCENSLMEYN